MESSPLQEAKKRIKQCLKNNSSFLDLSKLDLRSVPELTGLTNLKKIDLSENKITQIENLEILTNLIELNLSGNNIEEIKNIDKLYNLEIINLTDNKIREISNLEYCTKVKYLYLGSNSIEEIKGLEKLTSLSHIHLYHNNINKLEGLTNLKNLEAIFLGRNNINKIENLDNLINLKTLNIYGNKIRSIEDLEKNFKLEELVIHDNPLENTKGLEKLQNLKTLYLGRNSLRSINEVKHLINLETFSCENNHITDISPLKNLEKLKYLIISKNKIKILNNIEKLKNIEILDISNNLILQESEIEKIKLLPKLRNLRLDNNPIWKNYDIYLNEKWDSNHLEFYNVFINEYKYYDEINLPYNVVLLGNHSAGKSSLLRILTGKRYNNQSTHGLKIEFSPQKNRDFPICVYYDFGGQDFYHGIYRLFLRENSLKVLVINPENNQNKLRKENINTVIDNQKYVQDFTIDYWSKQIDFNDINNKNISDIYLIQSHYNKNQIKKWEYISSITKRRLNTFSALDLSDSKSPENIYFKNYLLRQITDVNSKVKISNTRIQLMKDILENIKKIGKKQSEPIPILELKNKYESLSYPLESFRIDLDQLSASGLIFYDKKIANGEYVWLNPKALVDEIFNKILSQELIRNQEKYGVLKQEVFDRLNINKYTLELLEHYNILFKHQPNENLKNTIEYIIPNYLPLIDQDNPIFFLSSFGFTKPTFTLKFLKFIPMGMINHLICFFGKQPDHKLFWRDLIIFSLSEGLKEPFRVMINLDLSKLEIKCFIQGNKNDFNKVSNYLFYCILRFYWATHAKDTKPASYSEFINIKNQKNSVSLHKIWKPFLSDIDHSSISNPYIPNDLYISLDENQYVKYSNLIKQDQKKTSIQSFKFIEKNLPVTLDEKTVIQPFSIFTEKEFIPMKKIFISYSRMDVEYKNELVNFLKPLTSSGHEVWDCGELEVGKWDEQIQQKLNQADLVICMLSINFFNSNYILEKELIPVLKDAEEGKKQIMCIIVKSFPWNSFSHLGKQAISTENLTLIENSVQSNNITLARAAINNYQFLPYKFHVTSSINNESIERITPLSNMSSAERDDVYVDIFDRVIQTLKI